MSDITVYGWNKRKKTKLDKVLPGDIFCFEFDVDKYFFGRIMSRNSLGHVAEIFRPSVNAPDFATFHGFTRFFEPIILDSYGLFERKSKGDWRVIAHQDGYVTPEDEAIKFAYGSPGSCKLVDIFDNEQDIDHSDAKGYPRYSPFRDVDVKEKIQEFLQE